MSNLSFREKKQRLPGQWPGTSRTCISKPRKSRRRRLDQEIGLCWLDFQFKAETPEKFGIRDHRRGFRMTTDLAMKAPLDLRDIRNVIEMPVRRSSSFGSTSARSATRKRHRAHRIEWIPPAPGGDSNLFQKSRRKMFRNSLHSIAIGLMSDMSERRLTRRDYGCSALRIFEFSRLPVVSLLLQNVDPAHYLAFSPNSATLLNLFFPNEAIFPALLAFAAILLVAAFAGPPAVATSTRNDRHVGRPASGGRPLHASAAERRSLEEISAHLSRASRFQSSLLHPAGRRSP